MRYAPRAKELLFLSFEISLPECYGARRGYACDFANATALRTAALIDGEGENRGIPQRAWCTNPPRPIEWCFLGGGLTCGADLASKLKPDRCRIACALPEHFGAAVFVDADDGGGFVGAGAGIYEGIEPLKIAFGNIVGLVERIFLPGGDEGGGKDRLAQGFEHGMHDPMIGNAQANLVALGRLQPLGHFSRGGKNERERPGRRALEQAKSGVIDPRVIRDLGEISANEREKVLFIKAAQRAQSAQGIGIANMAA